MLSPKRPAPSASRPRRGTPEYYVWETLRAGAEIHPLDYLEGARDELQEFGLESNLVDDAFELGRHNSYVLGLLSKNSAVVLSDQQLTKVSAAIGEAIVDLGPADAIEIVHILKGFSKRRYLRQQLSSTFAEFITNTPEHMKYRGEIDGKPVGFLFNRWHDFLDHGLLYQHYLAHADPVLKAALDTEFRRDREALRAILPTQDDETAHLLAEAGLADLVPPERGRVATAIRKARGLILS